MAEVIDTKYRTQTKSRLTAAIANVFLGYRNEQPIRNAPKYAIFVASAHIEEVERAA